MRFSAFEILATPILFFAKDLNSRTSEAVHARRTDFFLAGITRSFVEGARLVTRPLHATMADVSRKCGAGMLLVSNTQGLRALHAVGEDGADTIGRASQLSGAKMAVTL